ncbi:MAG: hypothetical protein HKM93_19685 [Desulfobacteraceae bacterium]|nr:hypothetical protein [Desulfobacteraceae bacterium]
MTAISTVGSSKIVPRSTAGRMVAIVLIITGICIVAYTAGQFFKMFI